MPGRIDAARKCLTLVAIVMATACGSDPPAAAPAENFNDCTYSLSGALTATGSCGTVKGVPGDTQFTVNSVVANSNSGGISIEVAITETGFPIILNAPYTIHTPGAGGQVTIAQGSALWGAFVSPVTIGSWTLTVTEVAPGANLVPVHGTLDVSASPITGTGFLTLHMTF
jgi:hypothetical protein